MEQETTAIRLKLFIEHTGLSYAQFADECGIPRPSLSQLISGRNKKISDILVGQIHSKFPDLNILWLLFGEGSMLVHDSATGLSNCSDCNAPSSSVGNVLVDDLKFGDNDALSVHDFEEQSPYGLFHPESTDGVSTGNLHAKETALSPALNHTQFSVNEYNDMKKQILDLKSQIDKLGKNPRKVVQIMVYYDDSTFETFIPGSGV